jgi:hypothetical protein
MSGLALWRRMIPMANDQLPKLSSPRIFLMRMLVFLLIAGAIAAFLHREITRAFLANPGLNGLILGVLGLGIILSLRQVVRLFREVHWVNALLARTPAKAAPVLLAPLATFLGPKPFSGPVSPSGLRSVLDSIGARLDEARDIARYLTGLLVFLGLLGTFWGLIETVGSIGTVIKSLQTGTDTAGLFDDLKSGLSAPIAGMSIAFTSSLFGLAGSLILGFLDLEAGQAQNRFFGELEDSLTASAQQSVTHALPGLDGLPPDLRAALEKIAATADQSHARATMVAVADLADGVEKLVQHMRSEQQMIRAWVEAQAEQGRELKDVLQRLAERTEERSS